MDALEKGGKNKRPSGKQEVLYGERTITVPDAYLEHPRMYQSLISIAQNNASHVVFVVKQGQKASAGAPGFARVFSCPVLGVVTTGDDAANVESCHKELERLGVEAPHFVVNTQNGSGIKELASSLFNESEDGLCDF